LVIKKKYYCIVIWNSAIATDAAILGAFAKLRKLIVSSVMSVCRSVRIEQPAPAGRIGIKFNIKLFFENLSRNFKIYSYLARMTGNLHENVCTFMIIFRWILLL
jgi:hypothetical protein